MPIDLQRIDTYIRTLQITAPLMDDTISKHLLWRIYHSTYILTLGVKSFLAIEALYADAIQRQAQGFTDYSVVESNYKHQTSMLSHGSASLAGLLQQSRTTADFMRYRTLPEYGSLMIAAEKLSATLGNVPFQCAYGVHHDRISALSAITEGQIRMLDAGEIATLHAFAEETQELYDGNHERHVAGWKTCSVANP